MTNIEGRVLIADDDEVFLHTTGELLRRHGYDCDCVPDAPSASALLAEKEFDVLLADIRMPGNENLDLIRQQPQIADGLPVILITGHPTVATAIDSIHLAVSDYLVKPVELEELLAKIRKAITTRRIVMVARHLGTRLETWRSEVKVLEQSLSDRTVATAEEVLNGLAKVAYGHVTEAVSEMKRAGIPLRLSESEIFCAFSECTRLNLCLHAIKDTVMILERTKAAFKSKDLGALRSHLQQLLATVGESEIHN